MLFKLTKNRLPWALTLLCALSAALPAAAQMDVRTNLPPGRYSYFGEQPGKSERKFTISAEGMVHWEGNSPSPCPPAPPSPTTKGDAGSTDVTNAHPHCDSYSYPTIQWRGKPVQSMRNTDGFLKTSYEWGTLKYSMMLEPHDKVIYHLRSKVEKPGLIVELLDSNDFKVTEFHVPAEIIYPVARSANFEARGEVRMPEELYRRAENIEIR